MRLSSIYPPTSKLISTLPLTILVITISFIQISSALAHFQGKVVVVTITETATATAIETATATPEVPQDPSYTSQPLFESSVLRATNAYRKAYNASDLTWNDTLADFAKRWARGCIWEHSGGPYGENLAYGYTTSPAAIKAWADEAALYDFSKPTGFSEETGHFTQLVWKATGQVGCAATDCGVTDLEGASGNGRAQGWYVVCEYWPAGNVIGLRDREELFRVNVQDRVEDLEDLDLDEDGNENEKEEEDEDEDDLERAGDESGSGRKLGWSIMKIGWWVGMIMYTSLCIE